MHWEKTAVRSWSQELNSGPPMWNVGVLTLGPYTHSFILYFYSLNSLHCVCSHGHLLCVYLSWYLFFCLLCLFMVEGPVWCMKNQSTWRMVCLPKEDLPLVLASRLVRSTESLDQSGTFRDGDDWSLGWSVCKLNSNCFQDFLCFWNVALWGPDPHSLWGLPLLLFGPQGWLLAHFSLFSCSF